MGKTTKQDEYRADPELLNLRHFLIRFKMGSLFPISGIDAALEDVPKEVKTLRKTYAEWETQLKKDMRRQ